MQKKISAVFLFIFLTGNIVFAQAPEDSWNIGFGVSYPRLLSIWSGAYSGDESYGAFASIQRNFTEHVGLRFMSKYSHMQTFYDARGNDDPSTINLFSGNFDMIYYLIPCESISPYFLMGGSILYFKLEDAYNPDLNGFWTEYQFNFAFGFEWTLSNPWKFKTEVCYLTPSTNKLDGEESAHEHKGLFGSNSDTYFSFDFGLLYYFSLGAPSKSCDIYSGIRNEVPVTKSPTLEEIEEIVKKYSVQPTAVVSAPIMEEEQNWVLVGVNFQTGSNKLTLESYPILLNTIQVLTQKPELIVEIGGHTDNIGSEKYNMKLSEIRAQTVKNYLVSKGISGDRLIVKGYGESMPVADNNSAEGRALNRRIEFNVIK
ncbi:MAG: OmpA family protein [Ignavibacteria bacterium]